MKYLKFLYNRFKCSIKGHSHPMFNCFHCGARSPLEFVRDENGDVIPTGNGYAKMKWIGWGWKLPSRYYDDEIIKKNKTV